MKIIYYQSKRNFGDDLNQYMFPSIFNGIKNDECALIGIGSILNDQILNSNDISKYKKKIVFGSGFRPSLERIKRLPLNNFNFDESWDIQFVRGPLSAKILNSNYISDGAYALTMLSEFQNLLNIENKEIGIMPHYLSLNTIDWVKFCELHGLKFINPIIEGDIRNTLKQMAGCKYIYSEAMHGAIIADILRIPWKRFSLFSHLKENDLISEFKWMDWLYSINLNKINVNYLNIEDRFKNRVFNKLLNGIGNVNFVSKRMAHDQLLKMMLDNSNFYLSNDSTFNDIRSKIEEKAINLRKIL